MPMQQKNLYKNPEDERKRRKIKMKIICPNNPNHKQFKVEAQVIEEWIVDEEGEYLKLASVDPIDVTHKPDDKDYYECQTCGAEAKVEESGAN
jgi:hypothetical protein